MRIISGTLKGRNIKGYNIEGTRPTMDRVRESLFSMIQNKIKDSTCLDLFSGTGVLGFEAISNGCKYCYFNDINKECISNIKDNIKVFNIDNAKVFNTDYKSCILSIKDKLDIVFLDPPYKMEVIPEIIDLLNKNNLLKEDSIIVCEVDHDYLKEVDLTRVKERKYGDKFLIIFENSK